MVRTRKRDYGDGPQSSEDIEKKTKSIRRLPTEVMLDMLAWIDRIELGSRTSLACRRLHALANIRMHQKCTLFPQNNQRAMRQFRIEPEEAVHDGQPQYVPVVNGWTKEHYGVRIEWPECQIPENIVGFEKIWISYFDAKVLTLFEHIKPVLANRPLNISIGQLCYFSGNLMALECVLPLCVAPIGVVYFDYFVDIVPICAKFPQLLAQCYYLMVEDYGQLEGLLEPPTAANLLIQWLAEPREDGQPKMLQIGWPEPRSHVDKVKTFAEKVKQHFLATSVPASFVILMYIDQTSDVFEFREENVRTGEQLALGQEEFEVFEQQVHEVSITRCAARDDSQRMQDWVREVRKRENSAENGHLAFCCSPPAGGYQ